MTKDNGRSINILLCIAGVLCCIGSGLVNAPAGLLADDSVSLVQSMPPLQMVFFYILPSLLMVLACALVILGKMDIMSLCSVLAAGVLSAVMDLQYGLNHQTFSGILFNMIGVILVAAGVALQVFATETGSVKVSRKAAKSRDPKEFRYERSRRPSYDDIYVDAATLTHLEQLRKEFGGDAEVPEGEESLSSEALKEDALDAAAAQAEQEAEIEAMLKALSAGEELQALADIPKEDETEAGIELPEPSEQTAEASITAIDDTEVEDILAEMQAAVEKAAEESDSGQTDASAIALANMADALETPNQTMTDFYAGIEEIFLDQDNQ